MRWSTQLNIRNLCYDCVRCFRRFNILTLPFCHGEDICLNFGLPACFFFFFRTEHSDYAYSFPLVLHDVYQMKLCNLNDWFIMQNDRTFFVQFYFLLKLVIHKLHVVFQGPWSFGHQCPWSIPPLIQRKAAKFLVAIFFSLESEDNVGTLELLCH